MKIIQVAHENAGDMARRIARKREYLVGISSGRRSLGRLEVAKRKEAEGKVIVAILPDSGERYLSHGYFKSNNYEIKQKTKKKEKNDSIGVVETPVLYFCRIGTETLNWKVEIRWERSPLLMKHTAH